MGKYKVKANPRAIRELDHIYKYIANEKLAPENAKGHYKSFDACFDLRIIYQHLSISA